MTFAAAYGPIDASALGGKISRPNLNHATIVVAMTIKRQVALIAKARGEAPTRIAIAAPPTVALSTIPNSESGGTSKSSVRASKYRVSPSEG